MLPSLSAESKCGTKYTNHSLRATTAKTGHRSLKALRTYKRTNTRMQMAIDAVILNTSNKFVVQESQPESELTKTVSDKVSNVNHDQENGEVTVTKPLGPAEHTFCRVMNNCTINICIL